MAITGIFVFIRDFLSFVWQLFTHTHLPGFSHVSVATLSVGLFFAVLSLRLIGYVFGFSHMGGEVVRTVSTFKPKISKERRFDEF